MLHRTVLPRQPVRGHCPEDLLLTGQITFDEYKEISTERWGGVAERGLIAAIRRMLRP